MAYNPGIPISEANALPVSAPRASSAATSTPLTGTASASTTLGPFTPQLGRSVWLTLSGTWAGTVALQRSTDGGSTKLPATLGGTALTGTVDALGIGATDRVHLLSKGHAVISEMVAGAVRA